MRLRLRWPAAAIAATLSAPGIMAQQPVAPVSQAAPAVQPAAQPPAAGTHLVKPKDTLWDLAGLYLREPLRWPEIYRLNTDIVENPDLIFPGEVLKLPDGTAAQAPVAVAMPAPAAAAPTDGAAVAAAPGDGSSALPVTAFAPGGGITVAPQTPPAPTEFDAPTVFRAAPAASSGPDAPGVVTASGIRSGRAEAPAVRLGDFESAPWVVSTDGMISSGKLLRAAGLSGVAALTLPSRFQLGDGVYIMAPGNTTPAAGTRFVVFSRSSLIPGVGSVIIPTGVIEVVSPNVDGATLARVVRQYAEISLDQEIAVPEQAPASQVTRLVPVAQGLETTVAWIQGDPVLPSIQHYLIFDATEVEGVLAGDQFTLLRTADSTREGVRIPEQEVAIARVVRVTPFGTTAIVVSQVQPAIQRGTPARLTARMP